MEGRPLISKLFEKRPPRLRNLRSIRIRKTTIRTSKNEMDKAHIYTHTHTHTHSLKKKTEQRRTKIYPICGKVII